MAKMAMMLLLALAVAPAAASSGESALNPMRRVINLLQSMQAKISAEAASEEALFDKYMCYCKTSGGALTESIQSADVKIPQVESAIKEAESSIAQLQQELKDNRASREEAKASIARAQALREKENAAYQSATSELKSNIAAMKGAIKALEKGMAGSFLQSANARVIQKLTIDSPTLSDVDRDMVASFLSSGQTSETGYVPQSGEITGILKEMLETMEKSLADEEAAEKDAVASFEALLAAKTKEIEANTKAIEDKTVRVGNLGVEITQMKNDLDDTQRAFLEDKKFLADLEGNCATKKSEFDEIKANRAEELVAIADTIKLLNDDDALELFKKTLPSPSLVQIVSGSKHLSNKALGLVRQIRHSAKESKNRASLDLLAVALTGKKVNFDKVMQLIDNLVEELGKEQSTDDAKKEECQVQIDSVEDKKKELARDISNLEGAIDDASEKLSTTEAEIKALEDSIKALDKEVAEQTATRKEENEDYVALMASDKAAKELIGIAKNRLNKFYNPKLYKPPPKRELTEEERITQNFGGDIGTTPAPGGIAGTGVMAFVQVRSQNDDKVAPPPPPESFKAYAKKGEGSNGVIAMMDMLVADLDKEMTEAETDEKNAQSEYESFMSDSAEQRASDTKSLTDKASLKADLEVEIQAAKDNKSSKGKEMMATEKYEASLHADCDWLLSNYDLRKSARADEVESLKNAKSILAGADYSLAQKSEVTVRMHSSLRGA